MQGGVVRRKVGDRFHRLQPPVAGVADDADDVVHPAVERRPQRPADGVAVRPEKSGQALADHDDLPPFVVFREAAPAHHRNPQGREESTVHVVELHQGRRRGIRRAAGDVLEKPDAVERNRNAPARGMHGRQGRDLAQERPPKRRRRRCRVPDFLQVEIDAQHPVGVEPGIDPHLVPQVVDDQQRAADQRERERRFDRQQRVHRRRARRRAVQRGLRLERAGRLEAADPDRGQGPGGARRRGGQPDHQCDAVRTGAGGPRQRRDDPGPAQGVERPAGQQNPASAGRSAQDQVLGHLLPDETPPARAVRQADRELRPPRFDGGQHQDQDVRRRDQEDGQGRRLQQGQDLHDRLAVRRQGRARQRHGVDRPFAVVVAGMFRHQRVPQPPRGEPQPRGRRPFRAAGEHRHPR